MQKGDIILVSFPFTNLRGSKRRPAVLLFIGELDVIVSFFTSKDTFPSNTDLFLKPQRENGLKKSSTLRCSKLATLDKDLVVGKIGELNEQQVVEMNIKLKQILAL